MVVVGEDSGAQAGGHPHAARYWLVSETQYENWLAFQRAQAPINTNHSSLTARVSQKRPVKLTAAPKATPSTASCCVCHFGGIYVLAGKLRKKARTPSLQCEAF